MTYQPQKIEPSYEERNKRWASIVRARLLRPANAVKDIVPSRPLVAVYDRIEEEIKEEPAPVKQAAPRVPKKRIARMERVEAIRRIYRRGITVSEIAERLGTTKGAIHGLYNRNRNALRSCPLVATRGRTKR